MTFFGRQASCCSAPETRIHLFMPPLSRMLMGLGALLVIVGALVAIAARLHLPLGRLPGDVTWRGRNTTVFFPLATSILLSVVLSLLFWLFNRFR